MAESDSQGIVELWAEQAFDAWVDEDPGVFERIKKDSPSTYELVKQAFMVGFAMGGGAAMQPSSTQLLDALRDIS